MSLATADTCPKCEGNLIGAPIPEESREAYGGKTNFHLTIGVEYQGGYDGISEWQCPHCGYREGRWSGRELVGDQVEERYGGGRR